MASWYPAQNLELHIVFVEMTKTYDTVNRKGLWKILHTFGCTEKLVPWPLVDYFMSHWHEGFRTEKTGTPQSLS